MKVTYTSVWIVGARGTLYNHVASARKGSKSLSNESFFFKLDTIVGLCIGRNRRYNIYQGSA